ncbi:MAG TPA: hypothetical protein VGB38_07410, partial [bacterium]
MSGFSNRFRVQIPPFGIHPSIGSIFHRLFHFFSRLSRASARLTWFVRSKYANPSALNVCHADFFVKLCFLNSVILFACPDLPNLFICAMHAARSDLNSTANILDMILLNFLQSFGFAYSSHSAHVVIFLFLQHIRILHHVAFSF